MSNDAREPDVTAVLDLLDADIASNPQLLQPMTAQWLQQLDELLGKVEVDLSFTLDEADE